MAFSPTSRSTGTERLSFAEIDICNSLSAEVFVIITNASLPECILPWRYPLLRMRPKFTTHVCQSASSHAYLQIEVEFTLSKCLRRSTPDDTRYRYFGIGAILVLSPETLADNVQFGIAPTFGVVAASFLVAAYRRPDFRVDVNLAGESSIAGVGAVGAAGGEDVEGSDGDIVLTVQDEGIGIPPEEIETIFQPSRSFIATR